MQEIHHSNARWVGLYKESFTGVSNSWIDPNTWEYIKIAVGLVPSTSHRSEAFAKQVLEILGRVGIPLQKADIIASVNDTTNAALKTARLLASEYGGECRMHMVNLAIEYAMSRRVRKSGKQEVNVFEPGRIVLKEARRIVSHIMDKRKKANWANYRSRNEGRSPQSTPGMFSLNFAYQLPDRKSFVCIKTIIRESAVRIGS